MQLKINFFLVSLLAVLCINFPVYTMWFKKAAPASTKCTLVKNTGLFALSAVTPLALVYTFKEHLPSQLQRDITSVESAVKRFIEIQLFTLYYNAKQFYHDNPGLISLIQTGLATAATYAAACYLQLKPKTTTVATAAFPTLALVRKIVNNRNTIKAKIEDLRDYKPGLLWNTLAALSGAGAYLLQGANYKKAAITAGTGAVVLAAKALITKPTLVSKEDRNAVFYRLQNIAAGWQQADASDIKSKYNNPQVSAIIDEGISKVVQLVQSRRNQEETEADVQQRVKIADEVDQKLQAITK